MAGGCRGQLRLLLGRELTGMWRYLGYEMKSGKSLSELNFNGPVIGVTFRW